MWFICNFYCYIFLNTVIEEMLYLLENRQSSCRTIVKKCHLLFYSRISYKSRNKTYEFNKISIHLKSLTLTMARNRFLYHFIAMINIPFSSFRNIVFICISNGNPCKTSSKLPNYVQKFPPLPPHRP